MRIVIDMQACQTPYSGDRGVGRYTRNLVRELLQRSRGHEIYFALNGAFVEGVETVRSEFAAWLPQDRMLVWHNHLPTQFSYDAELNPPSEAVVRTSEIVWETFLNSVRPDIIFSPNLQEGFADPAVTSVRRVNSSALYATTLHDLTPYHFREDLLSDDIVRKWYEEKVRYALDSDLIIADSDSTKNDIVDLIDGDPGKIHTIYLGYDRDLFKPSAADEAGLTKDLLKRLDIPDQFLLYVGGNDLCKNIDRLIEAYAILDEDVRQEFPLVLGGRSFAFDPYGSSHKRTHKLIADLGLTGHVITPGFIPDEDLVVLLRACSCFVFPSTHEGFGLPALEAMACGAPVIGGNRSSVAEVIANKMAFFDPYDIDSIATKIREVLTQPVLRDSLRTRGLARAETFSWEKAADQMLDLFEEAVGQREAIRGGSSIEPMRRAIGAIRPFLPDLTEPEILAVTRTLDDSFAPAGKPCIYLDISTVVSLDDRTGIQRVTRAVSSEMLANPPLNYDVELVYSTPHDLNFYAANHYKRSVIGLNAPAEDNYIAFKPGDILLFLDQAPRMAINHRDYIRNLRNKGVKVCFYVYDLLPLNRPEWFEQGGVNEFAELMDTVMTSDGAVCCSQATADDMRAYAVTHISPSRRPFGVAFAHLGIDIENSVPSLGMPEGSDEVLLAVQARTTFLMVGTLEPRKGHRQTLSAFEQLWREGIDVNLVIVGRLGWKMDGMEDLLLGHPEAGSRLFWLPQISDEYLMKLYDRSACLIAASEGEGFGLPLIEAARWGKPIIARDISVFREVAGDHACYFPDSDTFITIANAVRDWLFAYGNGNHVRSGDMPTTSWKAAASQIASILVNDEWLYKVTASKSVSIVSPVAMISAKPLRETAVNLTSDSRETVVTAVTP